MSTQRAAPLLLRALRQYQQQPVSVHVPSAAAGKRASLRLFAQQAQTPPPTLPTPTTAARADVEEEARLPLPRLDDPTAAFATRTTPELLRAYLVLRLCMVKPLVRNAEALLSLSRRVLGDRLTDAVVGRTFFAHFCAGVDGDAIQPAIARLRAANVQSIVDYAAEDDVDPSAAAAAAAAALAALPPPSPSSSSSSIPPSYVHPRGEGVVGRTYDYADEAACDAHVATFLSAIDAVGRERDARGDGGFAAIKVTALGNPLLLERMTSALATVRRLFFAAAPADQGEKGRVDLPAFARLYGVLFPHAPPDRAERAFSELLSRSPSPRSSSEAGSRGGSVDLVDWCLAIRLQDMPAIAARIARHRGGSGIVGSSGLAGEVEHAALDAEEVALAEAMLERVARLAERAAERRVRLMIDAEHSYFQGAIDHTAKQLMARYNGGRGVFSAAAAASPLSSSSSSAPAPPVVFNTYQCYLKDSRERLCEDLELARRRGHRFAAKLVRGAYMVLERRRAERLGYPSPIFDTLQETHANYDACVETVLKEVKERGAEVMLATHNAESISRACARMRDLAIPRSGGGVFFGQLLGMADAASFSLGASGYQVAKYVPYGEVRLVMPYLVRRAQENSTLLGPGAAGELALIGKELRRRALGGF